MLTAPHSHTMTLHSVTEDAGDSLNAEALQVVDLESPAPGHVSDLQPLTSKEVEPTKQRKKKAVLAMEISKEKEDPNLTSDVRTFFNTIIAFLGSGVLGLPFAFKKCGILLGLVTLVAVSSVSTYCMLLVVRCKYKLKEQGKNVTKYGEIGHFALGRVGSILVNSALVISQTGFCVAYLIFISTNAHKFLGVSKELVVSVCVPPLIGFTLLKHMKELAFVSIVADVMNFTGLAIVYVADLSYMPLDSDQIETLGVWSSVPFFFGVASYCFEGVGMVLPLENSMQNKTHFTPILISTVVIITSVYATFGICGYLAFGEATLDVLTLNMEGNGGMATMVKLFLCAGLFFTYPLMLFPVFETVQPWVNGSNKDPVSAERRGVALRASIVLLTAIIAAGVPDFGRFISFIGSTCCSLLAFVLPTFFYWRLFQDEMRQKLQDSRCGWVVLEQAWLLVVFVIGCFALGMGIVEALAASMDAQLYQQVLLAVQVSHSPLASAADRQAAYAFSEDFKRRDDCALYAVAIFKNPAHEVAPTSPLDVSTRQHFALHVLEHYVLTHWSALPLEEQVTLRTELVNLLLRSPPPPVDGTEEPGFLKEKKVALLAQIAKRQFPQRWPDFLPELLQIWEHGSTKQIELILMILRSLAEDCVSSCFNTSIPPARRKDILQGLNACLPQLFPVVYQELEKQYALYQAPSSAAAQASSKKIIHSALEMLKEFLDWMPIERPVEPATNLIYVAVQLLADAEFRIAAAECLEVYMTRSFAKRDIMVRSIAQIIEKVNSLDLEDLESELESNLRFHKKINDVLVAWGTTQLDTFLQDMQPQEGMVLNAVFRNLCRLFSHPSVIITEAQIVLWLSILKNKVLLKQRDAFLGPAMETLRQVSYDKYFKLGSPDRDDSLACMCSAEEFDDHHEYLAFYGNFRGRLYALIRQLVVLDANVSLKMLLERLSFVLTTYPASTDHLNARGLSTETSTAFIYHEGVAALIECVVKQLPNGAMDDNANRQLLHTIIQNVLSFETQDPILKYRQLLVLSAFPKYYILDGNVLTAVFEMLFTNINFVLPGEDVHGQMSNETMNVRRRALSSLVSICQAIPAHILPVLPVLCSKVQELFANDRVLDSEGVLLYEMLVLVSNSMENLEERAQFLQQIVQEPLSSWTSPEITNLLSSPEQIVTAVEAAATNPEPRKLLGKAVKTLTTLYGVSRRSCTNTTPGYEPFAPSWPHLLPNLLAAIHTLHALQEPAMKDAILKTSNACWLLSVSVDEIAQVLGGKHQLEEEEVAKLPVASKWSKWHKNIRDVCYHIMGVAMTQPSFFANPQVVSIFENGILSNMHLMEHRHMKTLLASVFLPFIKHCPKELHPSLLEPVLVHLLSHMVQRFDACYTKAHVAELNPDKSKKSPWTGLVVGVEEAKHDVVVEKMLVDLTRQILEFVESIVDAKTVVGVDTDNPKHVTSPEDSVLQEFVLHKSGSLPFTIGALLAQVISWKDTLSCRKAVMLSEKLVNVLHNDGRYQNFLARDLFSATLQALLQDYPGIVKEDYLKWDLINLLRNIYCRITLGLTPVEECKGIDPCNQPQKPLSVLSSAPREMLLTLPEVTPANLDALDAYLREKQSVKAQKNALKEFLEVPMLAIKHKSASSSAATSPLAGGVASKKIQNIPEKLVIQAKEYEAAVKLQEAQHHYTVRVDDNDHEDDVKLTSDGKTFGNAVIAFLGSGVLGFPYAFKITGIMLGLVILVVVGAVSTFGMLLLVRCKYTLRERGTAVKTFGEVGHHVFGHTGRFLVNTALILSQLSFSIGCTRRFDHVSVRLPLASDLNLIFIASNMHMYFGVSRQLVVALCALPLIGCSLFRHLKDLAYMAIAADVMNILGLSIVYVVDFSSINLDSVNVQVLGTLSSIPFFFGIATYCFAGVGMVLPMEHAMENKAHFSRILILTVIVIGFIYASFGICGYLAFGEATHDVVTLNMSGHGAVATAVKLCLCVGLFFAHPLMLFPVFEVLQPLVAPQGERRLPKYQAVLFRSSVVLLTIVTAAFVPNFGPFISFVGSTCCSLLGFVLPVLFYQRLHANEISFSRQLVLLATVTLGVFACAAGIYTSV
ncbi:TPA: hypothetical protein N0F65_005295 [Lagenidium giganteum]|uniref:Importin N-terminal domain-containing protein n=1 Tax=Lagenidium giganteum TaxID=4803 RepID=A0AAV2Z005_9STRA|nr:TPA: hypothetical protein N0F65_005295 [Lagenidium giganteum]